jgi:acetolactate synthase-1/2/3 large subunit
MPADVEPAGRLWDEADLVIAFGSDLDGMDTQNWALPRPPALIAVNTDPEDATKNYAADVVVPALAPPPARGGLDEVRARLRRVRAEACAGLDDRALRFLDAVAFAVPDDAILVCDMCIPGYWLGGFATIAHPRGLQYPVGWGTLGYAFPAAIGAACAEGRPVVSVSGDGGFLFAVGELATLAQEEISLTAVIVDDGGYGMLRHDEAGPREGMELGSPDFVAVARGFGVRAEAVDGLEDDFGEALARHVAEREPSVLVARAEALVPPPNTSPRWYRR